MVDENSLTKKVLEFVEGKIDENYRVIVVIVGPPGSGKSTIAKRLQEKINNDYAKYLQQSKTPITISNSSTSFNLLDDVESVHELKVHEIEKDFYSNVEDYRYRSLRIEDNDGSILIAGRGGIPNSIRIRNVQKEHVSCIPKIAQIVPMDGFHLSRSHLDHFTNPKVAHERRGAPFTFDSGNYLELCKILSKTTSIKPPPSTIDDSPLFEKISRTFLQLPEICVPGFDHSQKDPTLDQHVIDSYSRILILEGLYLILNEENWAKIYEILSATNAVIFFNIDIDEEVIEQRIAARHVQSGISKNLVEGVQRFRSNDLLNARLIKQRSITSKSVINIRND